MTRSDSKSPQRRATDLAVFLPTLGGGGAERNMVNLCNGLAEMGLNVDLVLANAIGPFVDEVNDNVNLIDFGSRVFAAIPSLKNYLLETAPTVMLATINHANLAAIFAKLAAGDACSTRLFIREANTVSQTLHAATTAKEKLIPAMLRLFYPVADGVIAPSIGVADDLAKVTAVDRSTIHVLVNPVVDSKLKSLSKLPADPDVFSADVPVILGVGSFTMQKDFQTLIRAFAKVRATRDVRLVILGKGKLKLEYENLGTALGVLSDIVFPGFVSNPFAFMSRAAVFALSSRWEGLPNVPIQALACGCPVVSTDCESGPREILVDGKFGPLVPVGDVDALAAAIIDTLDKPLPADKLHARAKDFSVPAVCAAYREVFEI